MNAPKKPRRPRLSLEELEHIDRVSTQFDRALRNGETLSIEELLAGFKGLARRQLLLDLLIIDLEYRTPNDLKAVAAGFYKRFPKDRGVVRKALQKYSDKHLPEDTPASLITFAPAESPEHDTTLTLGKFPSSIPLRLKDIDDYELLEELGRGGMGIVYLARHRNSSQEFAIKMLLTGENSTEDQIKRFLREAKTAYKLQHPNIVSVHQIGYCNGAPYFVMDYVKGQDLESLVQSYQVTQMEAALLIKTAANAIEYAHLQEIVHRDLKPSNLMLDQDTRLRITDFGLAKALTQDETLTLSGNVLGTPAYMPPEQALANRDLIGPRSDVYSLGAVLFFLLTGRPPFQGDAVVRVLHQVVTARPPHPRSINPAISEGLATICLKCLEKKPEQRYPSGAALADDLDRWQRMKPLRAQQPAIQSLERKITPKKQRLIPKLATLATAVACLMVAGIVMFPGTAKQSGVQEVVENPPTPEVEDPLIIPPRVEPLRAPPPQITLTPPRYIWDGLEFQAAKSLVYKGKPFGIGKISFNVKPGQDWKWYRDQPALVISDSCRVLYPSFEFTESAAPGGRDRFTVWFLIQEPENNELRVNLDFQLPEDVRLPAGRLHPVENLTLRLSDPPREKKSETRNEWWAAMKSNRALSPSPELRIVNDYFLEMLQRRWNPVLNNGEKLEVGELDADQTSSALLEREFELIVGMLLGFESIRLAMMELDPVESDDVSGNDISDDERLNLPSAVVDPNQPLADCEPLALRVPEECFYLHCRSVENYLWVRDVVQGWGGSFNEIISVPAVDFRVRDRIERQLAFYPNLAKDDGIDDALDDCALIGLDPYFHDGAAVGILFQAKEALQANSQLSEILENQRKIAIQDTAAELDSQDINGHRVSLLSKDHHRLRSFYVKEDNYHLITNSKVLATRFVHVSREGKRSLGELTEYRAALAQLTNANAAVLYVPSPFIRKITSPETVIEVERRRKAAHELRLLGLALTAAEAEDFEFNRLNDLKGKFLDANFGKRQSGWDHPVLENQTICYDNVRGYPGTFLPIADMPISKFTQAEIDAYEVFTKKYTAQWKTAQPVLLTFASDRADDGTNQVVIDIRLTPFAEEKYGPLAELLSTPAERDLLPLLDEELSGVSLSARIGNVLTHFHLGWFDEKVDFEIVNGSLRPNGKFRDAEFSESNVFFSASPHNQITISLINFIKEEIENRIKQMGGKADRFRDLFRNPVPKPGGIVIAKNDVAQRIPRVPTPKQNDRPAHLRLQLKDVKQFDVIDYLQAYTFVTGRRISAANAAVLNRMAADLGLSPKEAKFHLEEILGGQELEKAEADESSRMTQLQCPAGGVYVLKDDADQPRYWKSTGWQQPSLFMEKDVPPNYEYPFLNWVKELSLDSTIEKDTRTLKSHLELTLREPLPPPPAPIPGGEIIEPPPGPTLKITNRTDARIQYRYQKLLGTWQGEYELLRDETASLPLNQPVVIEYRTTGRTHRLLVGAAGHLEYTKSGWKPK